MRFAHTAAGVALLMALPTSASAYEVVDVPDGGTISGTVKTSSAANTAPLEVTQDNAVCGSQVAGEVVLVEGGKLANAVVFLDGIASGKAGTTAGISLDQKGCVYTPHVQAAVKGSNLTIINSDAVLHNVHGFLGGSQTVFNLAMPTLDMKIDKALRRSGLVDVKCDAGHKWMAAYIYVFDHPYFAVTGKDGSFSISEVPPGTHTLKVWHESLGTTTAQVTVEAGGAVTSDLSL